MPRAALVALIVVVVLLMIGCVMSLPATVIPKEHLGNLLSPSQGGFRLFYEDEGLEDCEADGQLDPKTGRYNGWPADCEDVFFPASSIRFSTEDDCLKVAVEYNKRVADYFKCSKTNPTNKGRR